MAEIWRKVTEKRKRGWGRGVECLLECGHVEVREFAPRMGRSLICSTCSTPPQEPHHQLSKPSESPRPMAAAAASRGHDWLMLLQDQLKRLSISAMVSSTPKGLMIITGQSPFLRPFMVPDPERTLTALRALEWEPTGEELERLFAGESEEVSP